ncbi:MAG: SLBB domain-containing protein [Spirochaetota bacterium]
MRILFLLCLTLCSCSKSESEIRKNFQRDLHLLQAPKTKLLETFTNPKPQKYKIGPGDIVEVINLGFDKITPKYTVSPDGTITPYPREEILIAGKTRSQAEALLNRHLAKYFQNTTFGLRVLSYENNKAYLLGYVQNPGIVKLQGKTTLLEVLSKGGLPIGSKGKTAPRRCSIIRQNKSILWVDIVELLYRGNLTLNYEITNGDVIYVPDRDESYVYIMGEVSKPGAYAIHNGISVLKAIGLAGGLTEHAQTESIQLVRERERKGGRVNIDLDKMIEDANYEQNYVLKENDIVYVPRKGIAVFNYYLRMINPFAQLFVVGSAVKTATTQ